VRLQLHERYDMNIYPYHHTSSLSAQPFQLRGVLGAVPIGVATCRPGTWSDGSKAARAICRLCHRLHAPPSSTALVCTEWSEHDQPAPQKGLCDLRIRSPQPCNQASRPSITVIIDCHPQTAPEHGAELHAASHLASQPRGCRMLSMPRASAPKHQGGPPPRCRGIL
jgi:hypothetical protein